MLHIALFMRGGSAEKQFSFRNPFPIDIEAIVPIAFWRFRGMPAGFPLQNRKPLTVSPTPFFCILRRIKNIIQNSSVQWIFR